MCLNSFITGYLQRFKNTAQKCIFTLQYILYCKKPLLLPSNGYRHAQKIPPRMGAYDRGQALGKFSNRPKLINFIWI